MELGQRLGLTLLLFLMAFAIFNDSTACSRVNDPSVKNALRAALFLLVLAGPAWAFEPFVVRDIRVEGIQRIEAGTVFSYLPVKVATR